MKNIALPLVETGGKSERKQKLTIIQHPTNLNILLFPSLLFSKYLYVYVYVYLKHSLSYYSLFDIVVTLKIVGYMNFLFAVSLKRKKNVSNLKIEEL